MENLPRHTITAFSILLSSFGANASNACAPVLKGSNQTVFCLDKTNLDQIQRPDVVEACAPVKSLEYVDEYSELGASRVGFTGYFQPSNWEVDQDKGDGGVDVTGAPNSILVEGANRAQVKVAPGSFAQFQIVIPAEGYVTFDWRNIGGSTFLDHNVSCFRNDNMQPIQGEEGNYFSSLLRPGDTFGFRLQSTSDQEIFIDINSFQFLTNAIGVVKREWTATDTDGNSGSCQQIITIERASIAHVMFPLDRNGATGPALKSTESDAPENTGWPVIDKDGNPATTDDQIQIDENDCAFEVSWDDKVITQGQDIMIIRKWTIQDWASGSSMEETQIIKILGPEAPNLNMEENPTQQKQTSPKPETSEVSELKNGNSAIIKGHTNELVDNNKKQYFRSSYYRDTF